MENSKKKTKGRQKIEMRKIEKKNQLHVTFSKRRSGLFKKASQLSLLCGIDIALLVQSPGNKLYALATTPSLFHRFLSSSSSATTNHRHDQNKYCVGPVVKAEEEVEEVLINAVGHDDHQQELECYHMEALEDLKKKVLARADELAHTRAAAHHQLSESAFPMSFLAPDAIVDFCGSNNIPFEC